MKSLLICAASLITFVPTSVVAQMVKSEVTASNGVQISKNLDEFAERYEYSAPAIKFSSEQNANGYALVAKTRRGDVMGDLNIQGFLMYNGEWRYFESAVFKGGDAVDYERLSGKVGSCRYGCTLTESFYIKISDANVAKHAVAGVIPIQIRSRSHDTAILEIPVSYLTAVKEVAR